MNRKKNILITGASSGIGLEVSNFLLQNYKNVNIIVVVRNKKKIIKLKSKYKNRLSIIEGDLETDLPMILRGLIGLKYDCILNNAGVLIKKTFNNLTKEDFLKTYLTNLYAPFEISKFLSNKMKKNSHILNIGSIGGMENSSKFPGLLFYSSSKSALHCLTQCLSKEFKRKNISVNALALGAVQTKMLSKAFPGYEAPLKPNNIAELIAWFLLSGQKYFNGQIIPVEVKDL